jgi:hypothetical protein
VPTEEARGIAKALERAGLDKRGGGEGPGSYNEFGLEYRFKAPDQGPGQVYISFEPVLPHGEWISIAGGVAAAVSETVLAARRRSKDEQSKLSWCVPSGRPHPEGGR